MSGGIWGFLVLVEDTSSEKLDSDKGSPQANIARVSINDACIAYARGL